MSDRPDADAPLVEVLDAHKSYSAAEGALEVLRGVSLGVRRGEALAMVGSSGAGKTTLLNVIGGLDRPTRGSVRFDGQDVYALSAARRTELRGRRIGFVFQSFHLLPELDVLENVLLPAMARPLWRRRAGDGRARARALIDRVGLGARVGHRPDELSGGEQQRVAVARALVNEPDLVLADEPTGNLDSESGRHVLDCLMDLAREGRRTLLLVTHNPALAERCDRTVRLADGRIEG
jgi:predicted ABC-type transport system involved in lysophospholipase L1 biosynthesis ATPase subunit